MRVAILRISAQVGHHPASVSGGLGGPAMRAADLLRLACVWLHRMRRALANDAVPKEDPLMA